MNPIDEQRLELDAVNNCKKVVKTFYQKKIVKSNQLLHNLDKMIVERPYVIEFKKHFIEHPQPIVDLNGKSRKAKVVIDCYKEVSMNATIARLQDFKFVARSSQWFYNLIEQMLEHNIDKHPVTMFMTGKWQVLLIFARPN